jgi:hypothetical protein
MALHKKFSTLYQQKFSSCFQSQEAVDDWSEVWAEALAGFDGEEVKTGLDYCRDNHQWPPTCAEFRAACKSCPKPVLALPQPPRDSEQGKRRIGEILGMLKSKPVDGKAYWNKVLETKGLPAISYEFAHKALHNLNNFTGEQL